MEKLNNVLAALVMVVTILGALGTPDDCLSQVGIFCGFPILPRIGFTFASTYYLLTDGTRCYIGCSIPINLTDDGCPNGPFARRSIPNLFRRQLGQPAACWQTYRLYVDVRGRICSLGDTYNPVCDSITGNNLNF